MVQVPVYNRSVAERPILQQNLTSRASPDDFGAAIGRGLQAGAQGVGQLSDVMAQVRDLEDMTAAKEADNAMAEWSREAMYGEGGFMTLEGKSAVDARSKFEQDWEAKRRQIGGELKSPGASRSFLEASGARFQSVKDSVALHTNEQRKTWIKEASAARVTMFGNDALAAADDPTKSALAIAAGQAELRHQAELEGWDADTLTAKEEAFISGVHHDIALRKAIDDPLAAEAYMNKHRDAMTGSDQYTLELALEAPVKTEKAKQAAAEIIARIESGDGDIEAALAEIEDPDVRDLTRTALSGILQQQQAAADAKNKALRKEAADLMYTKGVSPLTFPPELQAALGVDGMKEIMSAWKLMQSGSPVTDPVLKYELYSQMASDPVAFAKRDLLADRMTGRLSDEDFEKFAAKQSEIGAGTDIALTTAFSQADAALAGAGLSVVGLDGNARLEMAGRISEFQNVLAGEIETFKAEHDGKNPDQAEVQAMINRLLLPVVISTPGTGFLWGTGTKEARLFEAGTRSDGSSVDVVVKYDDIPIDLRQIIRGDMERALGRKVSDQEVTDGYERIELGLPLVQREFHSGGR